MTEPTASAAPPELAESAAESQLDRPVRYVVAAILAVVVLILSVVLYGLLAGIINPPAPRTAQEFVLTRAKASVETSPTDGQVWADYIDVLVARKDYSGATEIASKARKAVGEETSILAVNNAELNLLIAQKQYRKALDSAEKFLKQDAADTEKLIKGYAARGITIPAAFQIPWQAVTIDTLGYKAIAAIGLKKYDVAFDTLTTALDIDPLAADVAAFRGRVGIMKGDKESLETARGDFFYALRFLPDDPAALAGLAEVEKLTGVKMSVDEYRDAMSTPTTSAP